MRVLIACEFSGIVRDAFASRGCDAWSCDLLPTEKPGKHFQCDVREVLKQSWDVLIAHPPCTYLCSSGARWWATRQREQLAAIDFFMLFVNHPCRKKCIENPIGCMAKRYCEPSQIIQPWQFGHGETKATCLWLYGLPYLVPTNIVDGRENKVHRMSPSKTRWADRSRTYSGIAQAMAEQWSDL
jgi:hypothetical protein